MQGRLVPCGLPYSGAAELYGHAVGIKGVHSMKAAVVDHVGGTYRIVAGEAGIAELRGGGIAATLLATGAVEAVERHEAAA